MHAPDLNWSLILHGGAKAIESDEEQAHREGIAAALERGRAMLEGGSTAVDTVEAVVRVLEDHPAFNAGVYCVKNRDGDTELDAGIMDGATLDVGAVAAIRDVRHPVSVAKALLRSSTVLLAGGGANSFAIEIGAEKLPQNVCASRSSSGCDTVGCVALDRNGNIAVATSTGGLAGKLPGRVGDSPIVGAGFYADAERGGVVYSGDGEYMLRTTLASRAMADLNTFPVQTVMERAVQRIAGMGAEVGGIALDQAGNAGWAHNSKHFAVGVVRHDSAPEVYLHRTEAIQE